MTDMGGRSANPCKSERRVRAFRRRETLNRLLESF